MGKSFRGVEAEDHLARPGILEAIANDRFHEPRISLQALEDTVLFRQPRPRGRELGLLRGLCLFVLLILGARLEELPARPDPEPGEEHEIKGDDDAR